MCDEDESTFVGGTAMSHRIWKCSNALEDAVALLRDDVRRFHFSRTSENEGQCYQAIVSHLEIVRKWQAAIKAIYATGVNERFIAALGITPLSIQRATQEGYEVVISAMEIVVDRARER